MAVSATNSFGLFPNLRPFACRGASDLASATLIVLPATETAACWLATDMMPGYPQPNA
jgi:hypothetical protein